MNLLTTRCSDQDTDYYFASVTYCWSTKKYSAMSIKIQL